MLGPQVPGARSSGETRAYATLLANTVSPRSVAVMKRQIWEAEFQPPTEATTQANYEMEQSFQTADFKESRSLPREARGTFHRQVVGVTG